MEIIHIIQELWVVARNGRQYLEIIHIIQELQYLEIMGSCRNGMQYIVTLHTYALEDITGKLYMCTIL